MPQDPVQVALVGGGNIARAHARAYLRLPAYGRVVAVCDVDAEAARRRAADLGVDRVYANYHDVLGDPEVEAVDLCLPHDLHAPVALAALAAGKHVLVEKPMATTLADAKAMAEAAERTGRVLMVAQNQRYMPEFERLRELLADGLIGRVTAARADCNQHLGGILPPGHWLYRGARAGGGVVISVAVHKLDLLRWLLGEVRRVAAVQAITGINPGMDGEDVGAAVLEFESGAVGEMFFSYSAIAAPWNELLILYGTEGTVHHSGGALMVGRRGQAFEAIPTDPADGERDSFTREIRHFLACIRSGTEPRSSGRDNVRTMAVIDAIYRSARSGAFETCTP